MIDPHVHLRDWGQSHKETLRHGLSVAWRAGLDAVFEMPNTDPPLTSREAILRRLRAADAAIASLGVPIFHGLYAGLTREPAQIEEVVLAWRELFPRVVGLKMFAGHSTGGMGITEREEQEKVYRILSEIGFTGVLAVHCEKEGLFRKHTDGGPEWNPAVPSSHTAARPPEAEVASVADQLDCASVSGFQGTLHVVHVSVPEAAHLVTKARRQALEGKGPRVMCGLTPHHALIPAEEMDRPDGLLLKTNPPLRPAPMPAGMLKLLFSGEIDWIETDHAPHTRAEKLEGFASGIPCLPFYPRFLQILLENGMLPARLDELTHDAICRAFALDLPNRHRLPDFALSAEYEFDPFAGFTTL